MKTYFSALTLSVALVACGGGGGGSSKPPQQNNISSNSSANTVSSALNNSVSSITSSTSATSVTSTASENNSSVAQSQNSSLNAVSSIANSSVVNSLSSSSTSSLLITCAGVEEQSLLHATIDDETHFSGYGELDLTLSTAADVETMLVCLKDLREHATDDDSLQSVAITDQGNNRYQIQLSRYQLPVQYELSVYWGNPVSVARTTLAADKKSRVAFISTSKGTGDLASWTENPNDTPLEAADAVCTADANAAGLAGNYTAYLSTDETDAICRLRGGEGKLVDGCGLTEPISEEQLTAPWLDMKGLPIAYGTADIEQGLWRLPVGYDARAKKHKVQPTMTHTWTGSVTMGTARTSHCNNWSIAGVDERGIASAGVGFSIPNDSYTLKCEESQKLLCFSATNTPWALSQAHKHSGKLAWVQETKSNLVIAEADAACMQNKPSSIENAVAWFSDSNSDALCRLVGDGGKIDSNCGNSSINWNAGPWVRADGYVIASTLKDLTRDDSNDPTPGALAPILLGADATFNKPQLQEIVRTDTYSSGNATIQNNSCIFGYRFSADSAWTYSGDVACSNISTTRTFVYCFEK